MKGDIVDATADLRNTLPFSSRGILMSAFISLLEDPDVVLVSVCFTVLQPDDRNGNSDILGCLKVPWMIAAPLRLK